MKRILLVGGACFASVVAGLVVTGYLLPVAHVAAPRIELKAPREAVRKSVRTPGEFPDWRNGATEVVISA